MFIPPSPKLNLSPRCKKCNFTIVTSKGIACAKCDFEITKKRLLRIDEGDGLGPFPDIDGLPSDAQIKQWAEKEGEMRQQHAEARNYGGDERTVRDGLVHPDGCKCNLCQFDGDKRGFWNKEDVH